MAYAYREKFARSGSRTSDGSDYEAGYEAWKYTTDLHKPEASTVYEILENAPFKVRQPGVPADAHPDDSVAECTGADASCRDDCEVWDLTFSFEIVGDDDEKEPQTFEEFLAASQSQDEGGRAFYAPKRSAGLQVIQEYRYADLDEKPFRSSANGPLPPSPIPVNIQIERITFNADQFPDLSFGGSTQGKKMLGAIDVDWNYFKNKLTGEIDEYYTVTMEEWTHPHRNWKNVELYDADFCEIVEGERANIVDKDGIYLSAESFLDGAGKKLPPGAPPIILKFRVRVEQAYHIPFLHD
jgi:hypothetical protein